MLGTQTLALLSSWHTSQRATALHGPWLPPLPATPRPTFWNVEATQGGSLWSPVHSYHLGQGVIV